MRRSLGNAWKSLRFVVAAALLAAAAGLAAEPAGAATPAQWVKGFWPTAKAAGISRKTYDAALGKFTPDPTVLEKASNQAEFKSKIWEYLDSTVTEKRIKQGQELIDHHGALLRRIEARYGVDRYVVVAIWGMESSYGAILENPAVVKGTIRSLATLAYQGDFDGDRRRNIWTSLDDALASTANYLNKAGWDDGKTWGYEVVLPKGFNIRSAEKKGARTLAQWRKTGIVRANGKGFPRGSDKATLFAPAGAKGPAFLVLKNFGVIKRYNNANAYALAVGHLADRLHGYDAFHGKWPWKEEPLTDGQKAKLQELLTARGYYSGEIDGNLGSGSRAAIQAYQEAIGLSDDAGLQKILQLLEAGR